MDLQRFKSENKLKYVRDSSIKLRNHLNKIVSRGGDGFTYWISFCHISLCVRFFININSFNLNYIYFDLVVLKIVDKMDLTKILSILPCPFLTCHAKNSFTNIIITLTTKSICNVHYQKIAKITYDVKSN